jgi:RND family efflux transporter MFP subunit
MIARTAFRFLFAPLAALCIAEGASGEEVQGIVIPVEEVSVASPVEDIVREVVVEEGDVVKKDQVLARLDDAKEKLEVALYEKQIELRTFAAAGMETLRKEKMVSEEAAMERRTELDITRIQHGIAQERLKDKTVLAPLDGIVVKRYKRSGEAVERVEKMFDIVNIDRVYVQFYLDPKHMVRLREGEKIGVKFPMLDGGRQFDATIAFVDPRIDAASGLFRVKLVVDNPGHALKAGMRGRADFDAATAAR